MKLMAKVQDAATPKGKLLPLIPLNQYRLLSFSWVPFRATTRLLFPILILQSHMITALQLPRIDLNLAFITMIKEIAQVTLALFPQSLQRVVGD